MDELAGFGIESSDVSEFEETSLNLRWEDVRSGLGEASPERADSEGEASIR